MFRERIIEAIKKVVGDVEINIETPEIETYGDYSSNVAMTTFENAKLQITNAKSKNPREYAEEIVAQLKLDKELAGMVDKIEVAGPGFINFWLTRSDLVNN